MLLLYSVKQKVRTQAAFSLKAVSESKRLKTTVSFTHPWTVGLSQDVPWRLPDYWLLLICVWSLSFTWVCRPTQISSWVPSLFSLASHRRRPLSRFGRHPPSAAWETSIKIRQKSIEFFFFFEEPSFSQSWKTWIYE